MIAGALFAALKTAWDAAGMQAVFPGGYVAGQRISRPARLPALQPWPLKEHLQAISNKGGVTEFQFELGIVGDSFEMATNETVSSALVAATVAITANGPISLSNGKRLLGIISVPEGASYTEDPKQGIVTGFTIFRAMVGQ